MGRWAWGTRDSGAVEKPRDHSLNGGRLHGIPCRHRWIHSSGAMTGNQARRQTPTYSPRPPRQTGQTRLTSPTVRAFSVDCAPVCNVAEVSVWHLIFGRIPAQSGYSPEKKLKNNSSEKGRVRECGCLTGKRDFAYLVNLWCLVYLCSVVHLLDISVFMWYTISRGSGSVGLSVVGRRWEIARRFAGVNEIVTMTRRFGACIIDATWHVAKRFRHVLRPFRTITRPDSGQNHARTCTIMHFWAVAPIVSVEKAKIMHLWRLAPIVSVKRHASWRDESAGRGVSAVMTMTYGGALYAERIMAYKTPDLARFEGGLPAPPEGRATRGSGSRCGYTDRSPYLNGIRDCHLFFDFEQDGKPQQGPFSKQGCCPLALE